MAQDPKKINPVSTTVKTYPGERTDEVALPTVPELLPQVFRTDTNKKLISAIMEDMFQPHAMEDLNYSVGRRTTKALINDYLPHPTAKRQLEPGLVVYRADGTPATLSADEVAQAWGLNDRTKEVPVPVSMLDLPIDPDKFINWLDYYWIEEGIPVIYISGGDTDTFSVQNDIIGKSYYITVTQKNGKQLELKDGMRIVFQNPHGKNNQLLRQAIQGDLDFSIVADGTNMQVLPTDFVAYDKSKVNVQVNGIDQIYKTDYTLLGNSVYWYNIPDSGSNVTFNCVDYFVTTDADSQVASRRWQVMGVGTSGGIRLLSRTHQYTSTVYSKATQTLWDKTAVPWDSVEWDGIIKGINDKHYILMEPGASNRNANSRVNVWYHKETIQAVADFLDLTFNDIVAKNGPNTNSPQAMRPIVEFENVLEMFNHGITYRAWVNLVVDKNMLPDDFVYLPITDTNLVRLNSKYISTVNKLTLLPDVIVRISEGSNIQTALNRSGFTAQEWTDLVNTPSRKILYQIEADGSITWIKNAPSTWTITYRIAGTPINKLRILWLTADQYQNQIINITSNPAHTIGFIPEMPLDGDATLVDIPLTASPYYLREYYWINGVATPAQTRMTKTQQPLFELYDAENNKLSTNPNRPEIKYSTILEIAKGDVFDQESGYYLKFLTSQYSELTADNTAARSMYDIVYNHTLQNYSYYSQGTINKTVRGPYQYHRLRNSGVLNNELSIGYRRAWFKLKSWAIKTLNNVTNPTVTLNGDVWPLYEYGIKLQGDQLKSFYLDDPHATTVVENSARVARSEPAKFNLVLDETVDTATISGNGIVDINVQVVDNVLAFVVPDNAPPILTITLGNRTILVKVINVKFDPRNVKVKLNGLPATYSLNPNRNQDLSVNSVDVVVTGTGNLEIQHQGNIITDEHITAIPGLALNPEQNINLGEFTPSRVVHDFSNAIRANTLNESDGWINSPRSTNAFNALVVNNSSIRSAWTSLKMTPNIQDVFISRSLSAWRWYRKFITKLESNFNLLDFSSKTDKENLDRILEDLLIGITYSSPDAVSGMVVSTNAMNLARYVGNGHKTAFGINTGNTNLYTDIYGNDMIYVYVDDVLLHKNAYTINALTKSVITAVAPANNSTVEIYHASELGVYSGIPASTAKLGLSGLFRPKFVTETWGTNSRTYIQRHDGSRILIYGTDKSDLRNQVILELEHRIYNNCLGVVGLPNQQRQFRTCRNRSVLQTQAKAQLEWYSTNNINFQERTDYVDGDPWTYNYNGLSWRGIYINAFDTHQLDTAPWESLGYDNKPTWWDTYYSWLTVDNDSKRQALENALRRGITSIPGTPVITNPLFVRNFDTFPVGLNGELLDPVTWKPDWYTVSSDDAQQPWQIGSWGPAETAWRRSIAGTWAGALHAIDDYSLVHEFIDSSMNPFVNDVDNNSPKQKGFNTFPPSQFYQDRPTVGIGSAIFEAYREFNLSGSDPLNEIMSLDSRLIFGMGGFSDGVTTLKMYYAKGTNGFYIPAENFLMTLSNGVATSQLRYSAVRVEKDGVGFRVYGYDPGHRHFTIFNPITTQQSERTTITTPNGNFVSYLNYDTIPLDVHYGTYIADKQSLFTFFEGLQAYQVYNGLILDQINNRGTINNWQQASLDSLEWIAENWASNHFCIVSVATADGLKFKHARGALDRLDAELGRTGKILFANGRSALANELLITREYEDQTDKIVPVNNDQIVFVDFATREYDHAVYINRRTKYGELIIDLQMDNRIDVLALSSRRTNGWTGRPTARGVLIQQNGLLPGFDALVSDVLNSHKPEQNAFDTIKTEIAKSNIVPAKYTVLDSLIQDKDSQHFYKQGLQTAMGTNLAINAFFRNSRVDIPGRTQDVSVNEQWLINTGEFGNLKDQQVWEIELRKEDFTSNRQIVRFSPQGYRSAITDNIRDSLDDNIIDIWEKDPRWITRPENPYNFATIDRATQTGLEATKTWLPNAGVPALFDSDIQMRDLSNLSMTDFINVDQSSKPSNAGLNATDSTLSTSDIFSSNGFSRYINYQPGDYAWQAGILYKAVEKITGSSTSVFNSSQWAPQSIDGRLLPSVWVSDYGFDKNTKYKGEWTPNTRYLAGDLINRNGHYEVCMIDHTSGPQYKNNSIAALNLVHGGSGYIVGDIIKTDTAIQIGNVSAIKNGRISVISFTDTVGGYTPATTTLTAVGGDGNAEIGASFKTDTVLLDQAGQIGTITLPNGVAGIGNGYDISNVLVQVVGAGTGATVTPIIQNNFPNGYLTRQGVINNASVGTPGTGYSVDDVVILTNDSGGLEAWFQVDTINDQGGILTAHLVPNLAGELGGQSYTAGIAYEVRGGTGTGALGYVISVINVQLNDSNGNPIQKYDNGVITGFNVINSGSGYVPSTTYINIIRPTPRATPIIINGQIVGATLSAGAAGNILYAGDIRIIFHSNSGTGATATPVITGSRLTGITITNPGSGYLASSTTIEVVDPNWEDANITGIQVTTLPASTTTVVRSGVIDYIYIVDGGSGYTTGTQVIIADPNRDSALPPTTAYVSQVQDGIISEIVLTDTTAEFDTVPTVSVASSTGYGASASVAVELGQYWRLKTAGYGWNILQTFGPMYIEETCPNAIDTGLNESKVSFASPHGMRENDYIILAGANDGNYDKVHQVKAVVDDFNLLIPARSTSNQIVYNMVAFKLLPVKFDSVEEFNQSKISYTWVDGMKAYVVHDGQDNSEFNYDFTEYIWGGNPDGSIKTVNSETTMIDPNAIYKSLLLDEKSENVLTTLEVFDPFKGCTINEATQYITHTLGVDPAVYNVSDLGILNKFISQAWAAQEVGTLWWDTSRVRYVEYERDIVEDNAGEEMESPDPRVLETDEVRNINETTNLLYRATNWGKQFADSEVVIYEWTSSTKQPTIDVPGIYLDNSSGIDQVRYTVREELQASGGTVTTYYYWKRGASDIPVNSTRPYSALAIEQTLNDPDASGVSWISPIQVSSDSASIMVANIGSFFAGCDRMILRIEQNKKPEQKHTTGQLLIEGLGGSIIPDFPFIRLRDSLVGMDKYRMIMPIQQYTQGNNYNIGDLVCYIDLDNYEFVYATSYTGKDVPVLPEINSIREDVKFVWPNDNSNRFGIFRVEVAINNAPGWDTVVGKFLVPFETAIVKNVLEDNKYYAVIQRPRHVPDITLHPLRKYGNAYAPKPQSWYKDIQQARRTFIDAVNDNLLNVNATGKNTWNRLLQTWKPLLGSKSMDVTQYWFYADYVVDNYRPGNEVIKITSFNELRNYSNPTRFAIVDSRGVVDSVYDVTDINTNDFNLIYKLNGTIQFYPIWQTSGWDQVAWDYKPWDQGFTDIYEIILRALREDIFVGADAGYFNLLFFAMIKEALVQNPTADWIFKTTYLSIESNSTNDLTPVAIFYDKKDALIKNYINEVKPYHSEVLDRGIFDNSLQQLDITVVETMSATTTDTIHLTTEAYTDVLIDRQRNGHPVLVHKHNKLITENGKYIITDIVTTTETREMDR